MIPFAQRIRNAGWRAKVLWMRLRLACRPGAPEGPLRELTIRSPRLGIEFPVLLQGGDFSWGQWILDRDGVPDELHQFRFLKHLRAGDTYVDVGTNQGVEIYAASRLVGPTGRVIGFEPMHECLEILAETIQRYHYDNIRMFDCALGNFNGTARIRFGQTLETLGRAGVDAGATLVNVGRTTSGILRRTIRVRTLDAVERDHPMPTLAMIRINAENYDLEVIRGARELIRRTRPLLAFEFRFADPPIPPSELFQLMEEIDYTVYADVDCTRPIDASNWETCGDQMHFVAKPASPAAAA